MTIVIPLKDIVVDPKNPVDLTALPLEEAVRLIKESYGFLSTLTDVTVENGIVVITLSEQSAQQAKKAQALFEEGVRVAEKGKYQRAIQVFKQVLDILPNHVDARRNLGMAYLEIGNTEEAKNQLIDVLRLNRKDVWGYLLLGNIYFMQEKDLNTAEPFYKKAYELNPDDPYLLNNYAALKAENNRREEAEEFFRRAIRANSRYPNSYFGLATLLAQEGFVQRATSTLDDLFDQPQSSDPRSLPVYEQSRSLYLSLNRSLAEESYESLMRFIEQRKEEVGRNTGFPVEIVQDESLKGVTAKTQLAWRYGSNQHRVTYRVNSPAITPHLIAHELEHISLEYDARTVGRNKLFVVPEELPKDAQMVIGESDYKLRQMGLSDSDIANIKNQWHSGLMNQLYNCPLDMFIETRLHKRYEILRPSQFVSLSATQLENLQVFTERDIRRITPRRVYQANLAMNCAYALFTDWLYKGKTEYAKPYQSSNQFAAGRSLFDLFLDAERSYESGDEYHLIEEFAKILRLTDWFRLEVDDSATTPVGLQGPTNPELLKQKEPATVMYCLGALQRFNSLTVDEIKSIVFEIGLLGTTAIDYTKPDRRYSLKSIPGEQFSGLQLLAMMYVGFKKIDPTVDTGLDFKDAYEVALIMFTESK